MVRNSAFVFIKPHAVTDKVKELVKETFEKSEISIKKEGSLDAASIDKHKKIDNHYYAIASKATILTPDKLTIPKDKFKEKFELDWDEVLKDGKALNAMQACEKFEVDAAKLDSMWADCKKAGDMVKFGGGFYCGKLTVEGKGTYFVFNGFFMSMRSKFVEEGASIYWYFVEWESEKLPWADFRAKLLGPTDPATAPADSLRGMILAKWQDLGLKSEPNTGDNGVHASASPFEALAERINWLGYRVERDPFGKLLIRAGISAGMVKDWSKDPQVTFGVSPIGIKKSLFDTLEDLDSDWCVAYCQMISLSSDSKPKKPPADEMTKLKEKLKALEPLEKAVLAIQSHVPPPPMKYGSKGDSKKGSKREEEEKPPLRQRKGGGGGGGGGKSSGGGSYGGGGGYSSGGYGGGGGGGGGKSSGKSGGKSGGKGGGGGGGSGGGGKGKGSRKGNKY